MTAPYPGRAMTTVEEISAVEPAQRPTAATRLATGMIGPMAVVAALLSALTTCLVLANLTFVSPTQNVVVTLLAVDFVTVLEEHCGISVPDVDVNPANFRTIESIERYVESRRVEH